jgi:hypothetical protein
VHLGTTTNLTATNNTSGQIAMQADSGDLTLLGQMTNNGTGGISLSTVDGSINTGTVNFTSGGSISLIANAASSATPRTLTIGTGGLTANGTVTLASADDMQISGNVSSNNGNVFLAAGRSTGLASGVTASPQIIPVAATEGSADTDGGINLNGGINAGTGNITIYATEGVVQPTGNSGTAGLVGGRLTVRTFNDSPAVGIINLQNNTPVIGNNVSNVTLEARLAGDTTAPAEPSAYAASNIDYRSISSLVISGVGTAADYTAVATTQNIDLTALNIQAKNLTLIASAGDVNVNVPIKNAQINLGNPGGSLNLLANGNVNINASSSNQGVSIGQRIGTKTDDTHVGEPLVQYFDHDLKLIASGNIKIEGGIWITGDLNLRADASLAEAANRFATPAAGDGLGGVTIKNTSTTDVLEVRARNLTVGASSGGSNFPVQFLRITAGSGTTTTVNNNVRTDAVLRAGIPTSESATSTSNTVTGGSMQILVREDLQLTAGDTWRAQSSGTTVRNSAIAAILGTDLHICGVVGGVVTCQPGSQTYNAANFITLKGGTAVADNTGGGGAIASASALILGTTTVSISHGGTLHLIGGTASSFGSAQASSLAVIDPTSPLQIFSGGNVILEAGQVNGGLNAAAGARIINEGFIQINLGSGAGQYNYNGTLLGPGVILIGGPGTGAFSGSPIPQQVFSFASNPINISGGGLVLHQLGSGFADASILSGVNLFDESLLSYIIFAANEETRAARIRRGLGEGDDLGAPACK